MCKVKRLSQTGTTCRTVVTVENLHSKEQVVLTSVSTCDWNGIISHLLSGYSKSR